MSGSGGRPVTRFVTAGQRFGRLTVIDPNRRKPRKSNPDRTDRAAECRCDCGQTALPLVTQLLDGQVKTCGCGMLDGLARYPRGEVPAHLRSWAGSPEQLAMSAQALADWNATAEGQEQLARNQQSPARKAAVAKAQRTPEARARITARSTTHGLSRHPLYGTWTAMMTRCYDSSHPSYARYGARGITVYEPWHDVRVFITWIDANLGPKPSGTTGTKRRRPRMTLDRYPDNNGNYEPGNVRWADPLQQAANKRPRATGQ
jgi:hypothetical protein